MIVQLTGTLIEVLPTHVVLDVGGVGYELGVSSLTAAALPAAGEAGVTIFTRLVVREDAEEAESLAIALEAFLRGADWELFSESGPWRVVGLDTTAPSFRERDSSGRFVYEFTVEVTAVRTV